MPALKTFSELEAEAAAEAKTVEAGAFSITAGGWIFVAAVATVANLIGVLFHV